MLVYDIRIKVVLTLGRERQGEAKEGAFWCNGNVHLLTWRHSVYM